MAEWAGQEAPALGRASRIEVTSVERVRQQVNWAVMPGDHMLVAKNFDHYASVGQSAMRVIHAALVLADAENPRSILDFACGSGRVTRWFRAVYPAADLYVSDVRDDSLAFCVESFGATSWKSGSDIAALEAPRTFDLIWAGSLITHLSEDKTRALLAKFKDWLNPGGVCVVTTHGRRVVANMVSRKLNYVPVNSVEGILATLAERGFAYMPYSNQDVGFSVNTTDWLERAVKRLGVRMISIAEHAWDNHQDILAFQRV